MWFWKFAALGFAGVLDLAAGALFVHLLGDYFSYPLLWWQYVIGAFLGASPDIDLFYAFFKNDASGHHEYPTHRPIIGLLLAVVIGGSFGGEFWAYMAGIGVLWHYLHDTDGFLCLDGGGIAWLWPFSKKYWGVRHWRLISQIPRNHKERANDLDDFYAMYLAPTRQSVIEAVLAGICLGLVVGDLFGIHSGIGTAFLFWVSIIGLWIVYRWRPGRH